MNLLELSELLLDEKKAEEYLLKVGILKTFTECEKCGSNRITKISRGRYRCSNCESEWPYRKHSILHGQSFSASNLVGMIKLFELELTANEAAKELGINERTAQRIYDNFRKAIVGENSTVTEDYFLKSDSVTFSISIADNIVSIKLAEEKQTNNDLFTVKRTRVPNKEASFHFHHNRINTKTIKRKLNNFPIAYNHFWRFANEKLLQFRGTKFNNLYLFLKEIEFRYNNENKLYEQIVSKIVCFKGW